MGDNEELDNNIERIEPENNIEQTEIVYSFEHNYSKYHITFHTVMNYYYKIQNKSGEINLNDEIHVKSIAKYIEHEFKSAEQITRPKSAIYALKYRELSYYFIFKSRPEKSTRGNIYVVNSDGIIKTVYDSKTCNWYGQYRYRHSSSKRSRHKRLDKALKGTRRSSVSKSKFNKKR